LTISAGGIAVLATITEHSGPWPVVAFMVVFGVGMAIAAVPATDGIMGAVQRSRAGVGSAVNDTTQELGGALGVAILGSALTTVYMGRMASAVHGLPGPLATAARGSIGGALVVAQLIPGTSGQALQAAAKQAFVQGMTTAAVFATAVALAGAVVAAVLLPTKANIPESTHGAGRQESLAS
jgi:hypothetical protein